MRKSVVLTGIVLLLAKTIWAESGVAPMTMTEDARARVMTAAFAGSLDAQLEIALAFDSGALGAPDRAQAVHWYSKAATQDSGVAHLRLGMLCETGEGTVQSYDEARRHYEQAVLLGVPEANLRIGILFLEGWGVPRDPAAAVIRIRQAAEAGYKPAELILSDMFFAGVGVKADPKLALFWAERAAAGDNAAGEMAVGRLAQRGVGVKQDLKLAREWYQLSAEQDYTRGMLGMASTFLRQGASSEDQTLGLRWLELAAAGGNSAAAFHLAGIYLKPAAGVSFDEEKARTLLQQSADAGELIAREALETSAAGLPLREAFARVCFIPFEQRYLRQHGALAYEKEYRAAADYRPLAIKMVRPIYPAALRLTQTTGEAWVTFVVDTTGRVREPHALKSSHPGFARIAEESVSHWQFLPGKKGGRLVSTRMQVPVMFRISDIVVPADVKRPSLPAAADKE